MMMETTMIGNKIAKARKEINMSQAQLAQHLFISPQAVGKWERGNSELKKAELVFSCLTVPFFRFWFQKNNCLACPVQTSDWR